MKQEQENWAKRETLTEREILALALIGAERILGYLEIEKDALFHNDAILHNYEDKAMINELEERIKGMKFKKCKLEKLIDKFDKGEKYES